MLKNQKKKKIVVFWNITPYNFIHRRQPFEKICYLHLQESYVLTTPNEARKPKDEVSSALTS